MSVSYLTPCGACGHVANHHTTAHGCHVRGCPCQRFEFNTIPITEHNRLMTKANRIIQGLRDQLAAEKERK